MVWRSTVTKGGSLAFNSCFTPSPAAHRDEAQQYSAGCHQTSQQPSKLDLFLTHQRENASDRRSRPCEGLPLEAGPGWTAQQPSVCCSVVGQCLRAACTAAVCHPTAPASGTSAASGHWPQPPVAFCAGTACRDIDCAESSLRPQWYPHPPSPCHTDKRTE